nr:hypothetical protein CFP56_32329 [Quercus suber]
MSMPRTIDHPFPHWGNTHTTQPPGHTKVHLPVDAGAQNVSALIELGGWEGTACTDRSLQKLRNETWREHSAGTTVKDRQLRRVRVRQKSRKSPLDRTWQSTKRPVSHFSAPTDDVTSSLSYR